MSTPRKPWTFEPFEIYEDRTWAILDPNLATQVAIFFDQDEAEAYLAWRNKKQAKRKAKRKAKEASKATAGRLCADGQRIDWDIQFDWDGRC